MIAASPLAAFHRANALTYVSLLASIAAIAAAFRGGASHAGALIAVAVIADTFDGRFARMFARSALLSGPPQKALPPLSRLSGSTVVSLRRVAESTHSSG